MLSLLTVIVMTLGLTGWALQIRAWMTGDDRAECWMWGIWTVSALAWLVVLLGERERWWGLFAAVSAVMSGWLWWGSWRKRKDRRRRLAALGSKARARLAALARALRDASRPSPVLRPVHGRAG